MTLMRLITIKYFNRLTALVFSVPFSLVKIGEGSLCGYVGVQQHSGILIRGRDDLLGSTIVTTRGCIMKEFI
jgi:hypothetical protein